MATSNSVLFDMFLYFILVVKLCLLFVIVLRSNAKRKNDKKAVEKYNNLKEILHETFTICMGFLLVIVFSPINYPGEVCVFGETKIFIFIFGILSILGIMQIFIEKAKNYSPV
jgi:hypothetical protein